MVIEGNWFIEKHTDHILFLYRIKNHIYHGRTPYQKVSLVELEAMGKTLFLDNKIQSAEIDEAVFHEALVHPAMVSHPNPKKVLIMGGGEGATLREVLRYPVERAVMVDIDEQLVKLCEAYMPEWHRGAFYDDRAKLVFTDARKYVEETDEKFDVIISDLTEPIEGGPSVMLFTKEFYETVYEKLTDNGILVVQSASADIYFAGFVSSVYKTLKEVFPLVKVYHAYMFSFQLDWAFTIATKGIDPESVNREDIISKISGFENDLKFYTPDIHYAMFKLPKYLTKNLEENGRVIRDEQPEIWKS
ncbi:MAG: polyamine aminopropyltransferase [candidate division WOR-3 bacterium]